MSHEALGPQFRDHVRLYRGLNEVEPGDVGHDEMGIHWTEDPGSAQNFALNRDEWGNARESWGDEEENAPDRGTVVEALVHPWHIIDRGTAEHDEMSSAANILHEGSFENETTVRPGSPVHVLGHHYLEAGEGHDVYKPQRFSPRLGRA